MLILHPIYYAITFIFGAVIGSFLNVCIYRLPRGQSIVSPPSHCTSCGEHVKPYDNIPILSYILLGGRCRSCGAHFSSRYMLVELLTGSLFALTLWKYGPGLEAISVVLLLSALVVVTFIDLEHMIIPNVISLPGIVAGLALAALRTDWGELHALWTHFDLGPTDWLYIIGEYPALDSAAGVIMGGAALLIIALGYEALRKREGMGMGDVKLIAMIGAFLGLQSIPFVMLMSSVLGIVLWVYLRLRTGVDMRYAFPFGPFLSIGAVVYCFTGGLGPLLH